MSLFIDSVIWIGAKLKNDQWHEASVKIINKFINREIKKVYVTDYIILESVNTIKTTNSDELKRTQVMQRLFLRRD